MFLRFSSFQCRVYNTIQQSTWCSAVQRRIVVRVRKVADYIVRNRSYNSIYSSATPFNTIQYYLSIAFWWGNWTINYITQHPPTPHRPMSPDGPTATPLTIKCRIKKHKYPRAIKCSRSPHPDRSRIRTVDGRESLGYAGKMAVVTYIDAAWPFAERCKWGAERERKRERTPTYSRALCVVLETRENR